MDLAHDGREYCKWTVTTRETLTGFQVQLIPHGPWIPATYTPTSPDATGLIVGVVSLLVKGPDWPPAGSGIVDDGLGALISASRFPRVMCVDIVEVPIRASGIIQITYS